MQFKCMAWLRVGSMWLVPIPFATPCSSMGFITVRKVLVADCISLKNMGLDNFHIIHLPTSFGIILAASIQICMTINRTVVCNMHSSIIQSKCATCWSQMPRDKCGSSISHLSHYCCHHCCNWGIAIYITIVCNMESGDGNSDDCLLWLLFDIHLRHKGLRTMPNHALMDQLLTWVGH